jgi:WD40 repeat protein
LQLQLRQLESRKEMPHHEAEHRSTIVKEEEYSFVFFSNGIFDGGVGGDNGVCDDDDALCVVTTHNFSGTLRCHNMTSGKNVCELLHATSRIYRGTSAVLPAGNMVVAYVEEEREIYVPLLDIKTKKAVGYFNSIDCGITTIAFSPAGDFFVVASKVSVVVWSTDWNRSTCVANYALKTEHGDALIALSANGEILAGVTHGKTVVLKEMPGCGEIGRWTFDDQVTSMLFLPAKNEFWLVCGFDTGKLSIGIYTPHNALLPTFTGHNCAVSKLACTQDGALLASAASDWNICVWDVASGAQLHKMCFKCGIRDLAFNRSGSQLAACTSSICCLWTICEWSDRKNHLFGPKLRTVVYNLMCVKTHFMISPSIVLPQLPMQLWLYIIQSLAHFSSHDTITLGV